MDRVIDRVFADPLSDTAVRSSTMSNLDRLLTVILSDPLDSYYKQCASRIIATNTL
jgi:hypothetical protein